MVRIFFTWSVHLCFQYWQYITFLLILGAVKTFTTDVIWTIWNLSGSYTLVLCLIKLNLPSPSLKTTPSIHPPPTPELTVITVGWIMFYSSFLTAVIVFSGVSPVFFDSVSVMSSPRGCIWMVSDAELVASGIDLHWLTLHESLWLKELDFSLSMSDSLRELNPL